MLLDVTRTWVYEWGARACRALRLLHTLPHPLTKRTRHTHTATPPPFLFFNFVTLSLLPLPPPPPLPPPFPHPLPLASSSPSLPLQACLPRARPPARRSTVPTAWAPTRCLTSSSLAAPAPTASARSPSPTRRTSRCRPAQVQWQCSTIKQFSAVQYSTQYQFSAVQYSTTQSVQYGVQYGELKMLQACSLRACGSVHVGLYAPHSTCGVQVDSC